MKKVLLLLLCALLLLSVGCRSALPSAAPTASPSVPPTATPPPATATPLPTPTAEPTPLPLPDADIVLLTLPTDQRKPAPPLRAWAYAVSTPAEAAAIDIENVIARTFEGLEYSVQSIDPEYGGGSSVSTKRYGSRYGRFRETMEISPTRLWYQWEWNENTPESRPLTRPQEELRRDAKTFIDGILGTDAFTQHPDPHGGFPLFEGEIVDTVAYFTWHHVVDGLIADSDLVEVMVTNDAEFPRAVWRWHDYTPLENAPPQRLLSAEEALYCVNYARRSMEHNCVDFNEYDTVQQVDAVLTHWFGEEAQTLTPTTVSPAWRFIITGKYHAEIRWYVDMASGRIWNDHDGILPSPYIHLVPLT